MCDFIHVVIFLIVSKCRKSLKLTNVVIHPIPQRYAIYTPQCYTCGNHSARDIKELCGINVDMWSKERRSSTCDIKQ